MSRDIDDSSENVLSEWQRAEDDGDEQEEAAAAWGTSVAEREEREEREPEELEEELEPQSIAVPGLETEAPAPETENGNGNGNGLPHANFTSSQVTGLTRRIRGANAPRATNVADAFGGGAQARESRPASADDVASFLAAFDGGVSRGLADARRDDGEA